jgi:phage/plasmid-like protein (TIGR03299 family)
MSHNIQTMAYYGDVPWHGLGKRVPARATSAEMIAAAGLDWKVEKRPARGAKLNKKGEASRYELIRVPRPDEEEILLGVVSKRYEPLQNEEAFAFFDPIVGQNKACFETAGALGDGERIWAMAKMPDAIEVVRGDDCYKYLLLSNTHDGQGSVTIKFTSIRVVCQNTLMLALNNGAKAFTVRHSKRMADRLEEVADILRIAREVYEESASIFRQMAKVQLDAAALAEYLDLVFPKTAGQKERGEEPERWTHVRETFETLPDLNLPGVKGTLWAAYNAITRFEDYKHSRNEEDSSERLERMWFGSSADTKLTALLQAKEFASTRLN